MLAGAGCNRVNRGIVRYPLPAASRSVRLAILSAIKDRYRRCESAAAAAPRTVPFSGGPMIPQLLTDISFSLRRIFVDCCDSNHNCKGSGGYDEPKACADDPV
jgi:hypothetical protein